MEYLSDSTTLLIASSSSADHVLEIRGKLTAFFSDSLTKQLRFTFRI
jgi:hypothetical protein